MKASNLGPLHWANVDRSIPAVEFVNFEHFPQEIQSQVWDASARQPRLVQWGPGGFKPLGSRHASSDSFAEHNRMDNHKMIIRTLPSVAGHRYAILVDWEIDLFHRKCALPQVDITPPSNMANFPPHTLRGITLPRYPISAQQPLHNFDWVTPCQRFAIPIDDLLARNGIVWHKLSSLFPNLRQLVVMIFRSPNHNTTLEQLQDVTLVTQHQFNMISRVRDDFQYHRTYSATAWPALVNLEINYMQA